VIGFLSNIRNSRAGGHRGKGGGGGDGDQIQRGWKGFSGPRGPPSSTRPGGGDDLAGFSREGPIKIRPWGAGGPGGKFLELPKRVWRRGGWGWAPPLVRGWLRGSGKKKQRRLGADQGGGEGGGGGTPKKHQPPRSRTTAGFWGGGTAFLVPGDQGKNLLRDGASDRGNKNKGKKNLLPPRALRHGFEMPVTGVVWAGHFGGAAPEGRGPAQKTVAGGGLSLWGDPRFPNPVGGPTRTPWAQKRGREKNVGGGGPLYKIFFLDGSVYPQKKNGSGKIWGPPRGDKIPLSGARIFFGARDGDLGDPKRWGGGAGVYPKKEPPVFKRGPPGHLTWISRPGAILARGNKTFLRLLKRTRDVEFRSGAREGL